MRMRARAREMSILFECVCRILETGYRILHLFDKDTKLEYVIEIS